MTTIFDAASKTLLTAEGEESAGAENEGTAAETTPKPAGQTGGSPFVMKALLIAGTVIVLIVAVVLALRSANKKYGKDW